jgi:radical SAM superfamily enzyme YgiQ (UPF0313 family)
MFVGTESLNADSLAGVNKRFNQEDRCKELIERLKHAGIIPYLSFIFGFDEDNPDQFDLTLRFLQRNRVGYAIFWLLTPFPGTDLFASIKGQGRLLTENWSLYDGTHVVFETRNLGKAELVDRYWHTYRQMSTLPNMFRSACYNAACSQTPVREFVGDLWALLSKRVRVQSLETPFSAGIGLINRET